MCATHCDVGFNGIAIHVVTSCINICTYNHVDAGTDSKVDDMFACLQSVEQDCMASPRSLDFHHVVLRLYS